MPESTIETSNTLVGIQSTTTGRIYMVMSTVARNQCKSGAYRLAPEDRIERIKATMTIHGD